MNRLRGCGIGLAQGLAFTVIALFSAAALAQPRHVYLTWQSDPATTMTVNFQTEKLTSPAPSGNVLYDTRSGVGRSYRLSATGSAAELELLPTTRFVHTIELSGLKPATTYYFVAGDSTAGYSAERRFVTAPDDDTPIRFVVGGDMAVSERASRLEMEAAKTEPLFCVLGGDLAYANGDPLLWEIWDRWLDSWQQHMVTPQGHTIPIVAAIGNHEVRGGYNGS
jgi:phosphodiesterase/alkaline phosphatase D-like protein